MDNEQGFNKRQFPGFILKQRSDGAFVIRPIGITAKRFKTDPAFRRSRENAAEFGMVVRAGKLIRRAFGSWLMHLDQKDISNRLTQVLMRVVKGDKVNPHGSRKLLDGQLEMLNGFQVNKLCACRSRLNFTLDLQTGSPGQVTVGIPAFIPANYIHIPMRFKYVRIMAITAVMDLATESVEVQESASPLVPVNGEDQQPAIQLVNSINPGKGQLCLLAVGMQCYLPAVNGERPFMGWGANAVALDVLKCWRS
jgi:hypothetical protein